MQAEGSMLAAMFTGRWEEKLHRDEQGRVFLDYDPHLFQEILSYMRLRAIHNGPSGKADPMPRMDGDMQYAFQKLVKYLQLEEFMGYSSNSSSKRLRPTPIVPHPVQVPGRARLKLAKRQRLTQDDTNTQKTRLCSRVPHKINCSS